jgi:mannose-6-phosphate isomerase-like protein (cupin superfamily)
VVDESPPLETNDGLAAQPGGWYVVNARDVRWVGQDGMWRGAWLEPADEPWPSLGFNITVLDPGSPGGRYHAESNQEAFLVLSGECLLVVEGQERRLRQWDFFHCPPWTEHVLIGAGDRPAVVVAVGTRASDATVRYVAAELARRHGAAPPHDTENPAEAYAGDPPPRVLRYRAGDLS